MANMVADGGVFSPRIGLERNRLDTVYEGISLFVVAGDASPDCCLPEEFLSSVEESKMDARGGRSGDDRLSR